MGLLQNSLKLNKAVKEDQKKRQRGRCERRRKRKTGRRRSGMCWEEQEELSKEEDK